MPRRIGGNADVEAGAFFAVFGVVTALLSLQYKLGSAADMGPGFFPLALGIILAIVGLTILVRGFSGRGEAVRSFSLRALALISLSLVAFAVLMLTAGLLVAIPALVFISLLASEHFTVLRASAVSAGLILFCYVLFVHVLGISLPMIAGW